MGMWDTVKGWFSSGVQVKLNKIENPFQRSKSNMIGEVTLTPKAAKTVKDVKISMIREETKGTGAEKKTTTTVLGTLSLAKSGTGYPFDLVVGEPKVVPFTLPVSVPRKLQEQKGVLGAIGKIGAFVDNDKLAYFVVAQVGVKGTLVGPSDKVPITVQDGD
jgi:hypothetical protein